MTQRAPDINYVGGISRRVEGRCVGGETRYLRARTCGHESIEDRMGVVLGGHVFKKAETKRDGDC